MSLSHKVTEILEAWAIRNGYNTQGTIAKSIYTTTSIPAGSANTTIFTNTAGKRIHLTAVVATPPASITVGDVLVDDVGIGIYMPPSTYVEKKIPDFYGSAINVENTIKVNATNSTGSPVNLSVTLYYWESNK